MREPYRTRYPDLARRHWWWRARNALVFETLESLDLPDTARILDVGCAAGQLLPALARFGEVTGLEPDPVLARESPGPHRVEVVPLGPRFEPEALFDVVLMLDVLEHMDDPEAALGHLDRILRPGGLLVLTVPAFRLLWTKHDELNEHRTRFRRMELRNLLRSNGWRVVSQRYAFQALFIAKLGLRAFETLGWTSGSPPSVPWTPLNEALYWSQRLEAKILGGLDPPFGSTILSVAEKRAG